MTRSRTLRWLCAAAWCAGACFCAPASARAEAPARAEPTQTVQAEPPAPGEAALARARALTRDGLRQFERRDYASAIVSFSVAYQLVPVGALLYNLAQAERLNGDCAGAARDYRAFLEGTAEGPLAELAREHLASCSADASEAAAAQAVELPPLAPEPPSEEPRREAPRRQVPLASSVASAPSRGEPILRPSPATKTAAIVSFASSGAWFAVATYFGVRSRHASNQVSGVFEGNGAWSERAAQVEDQGRRDQRLALAAGVSGLVAAGLGVWLWTW